MRHLFSLSLLLLAMHAPAHAQIGTPTNNGEELIDRVVAVVGDTVLLLSDVRFEMEQMQSAGSLPTDPVEQEQLAASILDNRVNDLVLLTAAQEAGMTVAEEQVTDQVNRQIQQVETRFGSAAALDAALAESGLSRDRYRQTLSEQIRSQQVIQQYLQSRLASRARPVIDESEVREFFESQRATLPTRPEAVTFRQVVVEPEPSPEARQAALTEAQEVLTELRTGADFQVLARRFSDDEGTREHGGDLGWFQTGRMVAEFERVAFALRPGETSGIVESPFGFHIIRVERTRGPERQARHILIQPEVTEGDFERARERADSVAAAIRGGGSIATLAARYNPEQDPPSVDRAPVDRLPPAYSAALAEAQPGELVGPFELEDPAGRRLAVVQFQNRQEAGDYTLDDLRDDIRQRIEQQKMVEELLEELRQQVYVSVDATAR